MLRKLTIILILLLPLLSKAQCPSVSVTASSSFYCHSDSVEFTVSGVPAGSTIEWNLGSGYDTSGTTYKTLSNIYGSINVVTRITLSDGTVCNSNNLNVTYIERPLIPTMLASRLDLCYGPDTFTLIDNTPNSVSRNWVVAGKTFNNTAQSAIVDVSVYGRSDITLIVDDSVGCRTVGYFYDTLIVRSDINLGFSHSNRTHCLPFSTNFEAIYDNTANVQSINWYFEGADDTTSNLSTVNGVTYSNPGLFDVRLEVTTTNGCIYSVEGLDSIQLGEVQYPNITLPKSEVCLSEELIVSQTTNPIIGEPFWDVVPGRPARQTGRYQAKYTYRDTGYHDIVYTINYNGCISSDTSIGEIRAKGLKGNFTSLNNIHCDTVHTVNLINTSDTVSSVIQSFEWNVYEHSTDSLYYTSNQKDISVSIYELPSYYNVELITTDTQGCSDTFMANRYIRVAPYNITINHYPKLSCPGNRVYFQNRTPAASYSGVETYSWEFYNEDETAVLFTSTARSPSYIYSDTGLYSYKVVIENSLGCKDSASFIDTVKIYDLIPSFQVSDTSVCYDDSIQLIASSQPSSSEYIFDWELRDTSGLIVSTASSDTVYAKMPDPGPYQMKMRHRVFSNQILDACLDSVERTIYADGVKGSVQLPLASGCAPLTTNPNFAIEFNTHSGDTSNALQYNWSVSPIIGVDLQGATTATPEITFYEERSYRVSVFVTNSSGCGYFDEEGAALRVGVEANIGPGNSVHCVNQAFRITNYSLGEPDSLVWTIDPPVAFSLDSVNDTQYDLTIADTGVHFFKLVAFKDNNCKDSVIRRYTITDFKADFGVVDSSLLCAPQTFEFYNLSVNADSLFWFFEDGGSLRNDTSNAFYTFNTNDTFDVTAVAYSNLGCYDTITKLDFVNIIGPTAALSLANTSGCAPLTVDIVNESRNFSLSFIDYGDGSALDSSGATQHSYVVSNGDSLEYFSPTLYVENVNGCLTSITLDSAIRVYQTPVLMWTIGPNDSLCPGLFLNFSDPMTFADSIRWSWDGALLSSNPSDSILMSDTGDHRIDIFVQNDQGCTARDSGMIYTHSIPPLLFDTSFYLCSEDRISKSVWPEYGSIGAIYSWNMGEAGNADNFQTGDSGRAWINYQSSGLKTIRVTADYFNGCQMQDSTEVFVIGLDSLPAVEINYVTVDDAGGVTIDHQACNYKFFDQYELRSNGTAFLSESNSTVLSQYDAVGVSPPNVYCYTISVQDQCGKSSPQSPEHCAIVLSTSSTNHKIVDLNWTPYIGWNAVNRYEVFRKVGTAPYVKIGEVDGLTTSYSDSNLCQDNYTYHVSAIQEAGPYSSRSNASSIQSLYIPNTSTPSIKYATVDEQLDVFVLWNQSQYDDGTLYELSKFESSFANQVDQFLLSDTFYNDFAVSTSDYSYLYSLVEIDPCNLPSGTGRYGKTILLTGFYEVAGSRLNWSAYEDWEQGVDRYQILVREFGGYTIIDEVNAGTFTYFDPAIHEENADGKYEYKIRAIGVDGDSSLSNPIFLSGGALALIPNAFSPNSDDINDVFKPYMRFAVQSSDQRPTDFQFSIYNRWGQLVYFSNDRDAGWDGNYNGAPAQQDVYFYLLKITDAKGRSSFFDGTLTLLR